MLRYLVDTDICIYALKKRNRNVQLKFGENDGTIGVSDISLFELTYGAEGYDNREFRLGQIDALAARIEIVHLDTAAAMLAGRIRATLDKQGRRIGAYDCLIAGIARSMGLILVTNNIREYARVEGLAIESWA
jgi:tRNA(fMet)-specific endonuclease VapC